MLKPYIVITRPEAQGEDLKNSLEKLGFIVLHVPTLKIQPKPIDSEVMAKLIHTEYAIFVSPAAIETSKALWPLFRAKTVFAMGRKSAGMLEKAGFTQVHCPHVAFTSEALLALPELNSFSKSIAIIRGQEGRPLLAETLQQRGHRIEIVQTYERQPILAIDQKFSKIVERNEQVLIIITNESSLSLLNYRVNSKIYDKLKRLPLIVSSQRLLILAKEEGFTGEIYLAANASDQAIIECIQSLFVSRGS